MNEVGMVDDGYLFEFRSKDGRLLKIRPLLPEDAHHLVDLFDHMGPESRFLRFNVALSNPDRELVWTEARRLANVDPDKDGAWLVFADFQNQTEVPVGGARYIRIDDRTAEASLVVRDDQQNKGIGAELLRILVEQARQAGLEKLIATVQRSNRKIFHLLVQYNLRLEFDSEGGYTTITAYLE
jgi:acetyltransferase